MGTYLSRTFSGANTSRKTFTLSFWVKRSKFGSVVCPISAETNNNDYDQITFASSDQFDVNNVAGGSDVISFKTNMKFRDPSAWYHIVTAIDTTQASSSNGIKIYVNGILQTSFASSTYAQDATFEIGRDGSTTSIGRRQRDQDGYGVGYLSEFYYIDGQQKAATDFGQTDSTTGIWKPKTYSGTYGNNGFRLEFKNSGALGTDTSGNAETFTVNNAGTGAQVVDTPSNVFATLNPLTGNTQLTSDGYSLGNTRVNSNVTGVSNSNYLASYSSLGVTAGKWYAEFKITGNLYSSNQSDATTLIGVGSGIYTFDSGNQNTAIGGFTQWWLDHQDTRVVVDGNLANTGLASVSQNDIIGVYLNCDTAMPTVTFHLNGSAVSGATNSPYNVRRTGSNNVGDNNPIFFIPVVRYASGSNNGKVDCNFGNPSYTITSGNADANGHGNFEYSPTLGGVNYYSLCTENLNTYG